MDHQTGESQDLTSIIISNLSKQSFTNQGGDKNSLSFVDQLRSEIEGLPGPSDAHTQGHKYYEANLDLWSNIPFLNRVVIIMKDEKLASLLHNWLTQSKKLPEEVKVTLQVNLLAHSPLAESYDEGRSLSSNSSISNFQSASGQSLYDSTEYSEPEPHHFDTERDLSKLGYDKPSDESNELEGNGKQKESNSGKKTLFKPFLSLDTNTAKKADLSSLNSPTITLEESS